MKKFFLIILFFYLSRISFSQSASTVIDYNGAWALGCCTVCGADYWCFNDNHPGACGQGAPCLTRTFVDPIPAGNIVTSIMINYYTADCYGNSLSATIDGDPAPTVNEQNLGCWCANIPCGLSATTSDTYTCGFPTYVYGGNNNFQLCTGVDVCVDRVQLVINYVPGVPPSNATYTWTGTKSTDWFDQCNWDTKTVPNSTKNVVIPGGTSFQPTIAATGAACNTLTVNSSNGAVLTISVANALTITQ